MSPDRNRAASDSADEIATIRVELRGTDPVVWRQVEVPTSITLKGLHDIVQAAMGWCDYHCAEAKEWLTDYDPDTIDELLIKYALGPIANRRNPARAPMPREKVQAAKLRGRKYRCGGQGRTAP
jgi:Plasmid pRiA4b ORF-3-like protein